MLNSLLLLRKLRGNLKLSRAELEEIQRKKLKGLLKHAYENVPYYRGLFDSNRIKPEDIRNIHDLENIPVTDKAVLRSMKRADIIAKNIDLQKCVEVFTSGSTGIPTHIYFTQRDLEFLDLIYLRSFLENGLRFKYKRAFVLDPHSFETKKCWYHWFGLATYVNISCFLDPREQAKALIDAKPDFIHGYPSSLKEIAEIVLELEIKGIQPRIISTAAEMLHKKDRVLIGSAFGVDIYDRYAARECGNIAWECDRHAGYHINMDSLVVEFIKDGHSVEPGERGDVVITNLHSYAMPFIRYRIGDIAVPSANSCPCGMELPLMKIFEGRDEDFIVLNNGRKISPMAVTGTLDHIPGLKQFRVIQEERDLMVVQIVAGTKYSQDVPIKTENLLRELVGGEMRIEVRMVSEISKEKSGKIRAVISKVSNSQKSMDAIG
jgi:phenylacetate-CoA ligase